MPWDRKRVKGKGISVTISEPCYCTREDVKQALDIQLTARNDAQIDLAIDSASRDVEGELHRTFYPTIATHYFDWPNYQYAYPWRLWLNDMELADVTVNVPVLSSGGVAIPNSSIFWEPVNQAPPYTYVELNRSTVAAFGVSATAQRDISITGTFGFWIRTNPAGALAAAMSDTTSTTIQITDSSKIGVGDNILIDAERLVVSGRSMVTTGQTQQTAGAGTASAADVALTVTDGTKYFTGEILLLDSERMLIIDIAGNVLTVKRAWDGSVLATHSGATIYALRQLTVTRGDLGTTATTHSNTAPINVAVVPSLVHELTLGIALNNLLQNQAGYARTQGQGAGAQTNIGQSLDEIRTRCYNKFGRKARQRVI
jgi:hypothetical protein